MYIVFNVLFAEIYFIVGRKSFCLLLAKHTTLSLQLHHHCFHTHLSCFMLFVLLTLMPSTCITASLSFTLLVMCFVGHAVSHVGLWGISIRGVSHEVEYMCHICLFPGVD